MAYWRLYYYAVWACKNRELLIVPELEVELYKYFFIKSRELGGDLNVVGGMEDHVHLVFSLPPKYAIADFIGMLKGSSSHWITHVLNYSGDFDWQRGYGVLSFGEQGMMRVIAYVKNQKEHHRTDRLNTRFETWSEDEDGAASFWNGVEGPPRNKSRG